MRKLGFAVLALASALASAETLTFAWDPVDDSRVDHYVLGQGTDPRPPKGAGTYGFQRYTVPGDQSMFTVQIDEPSPGPGGLWRFAVMACNADGSLCSDWSNEVEVDVRGAIPIPQNFRLDSITFSAPQIEP